MAEPTTGGERMRARTAKSRIVAGGGAFVLALALAACGSSSKPAASPTTTAAPTTAAPTTAAPDEAVVSANQVRVIPGSATGKSPCEEAAPTPASPGQVGAGVGGSSDQTPADVAASEHGVRGMVQQVKLTNAEQGELKAQMAAAKEVTDKYPTVKDAEAAGYMKSTPYVPCIGAHYTNIGLTGTFDPSRPSELLYAGTDPDSKIVGLSFLVYHPGGPPPGFAGPNDHWHQHNANGGLCFSGTQVIGGEETTRQECAARGGHKSLLTDIWMVHAWVAPDITCRWGVFSGECPNLGGTLAGNANTGPHPSKLNS
jgi:hypothetical protein